MPYFRDTAKDLALADLTNVTALHLCSSEPADFAAVGSSTLGNKASPSIGAAADGVTDGRRRTIAAISDGTMTGAGSATHWALVSADTLIASGALAAAMSMSASGTFTLAEFSITVRDAVSES
jgi:hypothetical protein